jgi:hypothetical protein
MSKQQCLENIKKKNGVYCGDSYCSSIQQEINEYCAHSGLPPYAPVPQLHDGNKCWCCCSMSLPVESSAGEYRPSDEIRPGDMLRTTGRDRDRWEQRQVTDVSELAGRGAALCYWAGFAMASGEQRQLVVTADHLFLLPDGKLKPVQDLRPGERVAQADGNAARVAYIAAGRSSCSFPLFALGAFDRLGGGEDPLDGHLVNCFGLVTADLAVQTAFYAGELDDLVDRAAATATPPAHRDDPNVDAFARLVADPTQWPRGFAVETPATRADNGTP